MEPLTIEYQFRMRDGKEDLISLCLDPVSLELIDANLPPAPPWTALTFKQCPNCPLSEADHPFCPLARHLVNLVNRFECLISYDWLHVEVKTVERFISQETTAQRALSSLMGLIFPTSGCPRTAFFKPMARFHLPFSSEDETIYRATSMYLLAQYFRQKNGQTADIALTGLNDIYAQMQEVNRAIASRLRSASSTDASVNALIILDMFAKTLPCVIRDSVEELRHLFVPYLNP